MKFSFVGDEHSKVFVPRAEGGLKENHDLRQSRRLCLIQASHIQKGMPLAESRDQFHKH